MLTKLKYSDIVPYVEKKLVSMRIHPDNSDIAIFNYTEEVQVTQAWDNVTMTCRGLIMNIKTDEYISNPFPKFFNYDQWLAMGNTVDQSLIPEVTEKMDGFLGVLYWLNDKPFIATRGAFESFQAVWATNWLRQHPEIIQYLDKKYTYLFEIIHPDSKIVIRYKESGLILLAVREIETGKDISLNSIKYAGKITDRVTFSSVEELKAQNIANKEGYVLYYKETDLRLKIKFAEYLRVHKEIAGLSEVRIWEKMRDTNTPFITSSDLVNDVPDEFLDWVNEKIEMLKEKFYTLEEVCKEELKAAIDKSEDFSDKSIALQITKTFHSGVCFAMYNNKDYYKGIIKLIRPVGKVTSFTDQK